MYTHVVIEEFCVRACSIHIFCARTNQVPQRKIYIFINVITLGAAHSPPHRTRRAQKSSDESTNDASEERVFVFFFDTFFFFFFFF